MSMSWTQHSTQRVNPTGRREKFRPSSSRSVQDTRVGLRVSTRSVVMSGREKLHPISLGTCVASTAQKRG